MARKAASGAAAEGEQEHVDQAAGGGEQVSEQQPAAEERPEDKAADKDDDNGEIVPVEGGRTMSDKAIALLKEVCAVFGISPFVETRPRELLSWNFYPADRLEDRPAAVVVVTAGGVKLKWFDDEDQPLGPDRLRASDPQIDAQDRNLHVIFNAFTRDPQKNVVPTDLPKDLTLPHQAVTGLVPTGGAHHYRKGYLREGGKTEGERRAAARRRAAKDALKKKA